MTKIYTKTGDLGTTSLLGKSKVSKTDLRVIGYGNLDELNSSLGEIQNYIKEKDKELLTKIIFEIFTISSYISCVSEKFEEMLPKIKEELLSEIESRIDIIHTSLPELKSFILPIGTIEYTRIHQARTITRRCERSLVEIKEEINPFFIQLLNRLSDYIFILARKYLYDKDLEEITWSSN